MLAPPARLLPARLLLVPRLAWDVLPPTLVLVMPPTSAEKVRLRLMLRLLMPVVLASVFPNPNLVSFTNPTALAGRLPRMAVVPVLLPIRPPPMTPPGDDRVRPRLYSKLVSPIPPPREESGVPEGVPGQVPC